MSTGCFMTPRPSREQTRDTLTITPKQLHFAVSFKLGLQRPPVPLLLPLPVSCIPYSSNPPQPTANIPHTLTPSTSPHLSASTTSPAPKTLSMRSKHPLPGPSLASPTHPTTHCPHHPEKSPPSPPTTRPAPTPAPPNNTHSSSSFPPANETQEKSSWINYSGRLISWTVTPASVETDRTDVSNGDYPSAQTNHRRLLAVKMTDTPV